MPKTMGLDFLRIEAPCPKSWESMAGDELVRYCEHCQMNVYNLSGMTSQEALKLVQNREGRLCVRFWQRTDGRIITSDCSLEGRRVVSRRLIHSAATTAAILAIALSNNSCSKPKAAPHQHTAACNPANQAGKKGPGGQPVVVVVGMLATDQNPEPNTYVYRPEDLSSIPLK